MKTYFTAMSLFATVITAVAFAPQLAYAGQVSYFTI